MKKLFNLANKLIFLCQRYNLIIEELNFLYLAYPLSDFNEDFNKIYITDLSFFQWN